MDANAVAGMIFTLLLALFIGGFILLYPLSRRLGELLQARLQDRHAPRPDAGPELDALREAVAELSTEVQRLGDRQDFMERLLSQRMDPRPLGAPADARDRAER